MPPSTRSPPTDLDDDCLARQLRLGFDSAGRLLMVVVLRFDSGSELFIHAMKARRQYLDLSIDRTDDHRGVPVSTPASGA